VEFTLLVGEGRRHLQRPAPIPGTEAHPQLDVGGGREAGAPHVHGVAQQRRSELERQSALGVSSHLSPHDQTELNRGSYSIGARRTPMRQPRAFESGHLSRRCLDPLEPPPELPLDFESWFVFNAPPTMPDAAPAFRPPRQARSRKALEAVLEAGLELLEEGGVEALRIADVAERAGVSVGTVYNRFDGKDALFHTIQQRYIERVIAEHTLVYGDDGWAALSTIELIDRAIRVAAGVLANHATVLRVFMHQGGADPTVARQGSAGTRIFAGQFESVLLTRAAEFRTPQPAAEAVDLCFRMVYDVLARRILFGPTFESDLATGWDRTVDGLVSAATAYLLLVAVPESAT
jgi:AcrR family transcriptional regulator